MTQDARPARPPAAFPFTRRRSVVAALVGLVAGAVVGCATFAVDKGEPLVPGKVATRTGPFAVYTHARPPADAPPVRCLMSLEDDLASHLGLRAAPDGPPVEVYILKDREAFGHFLRFYHPELPPRRAFFLAQGPKRMVYTFANDRLDEDLRHEATHALLHATVGDLPLWLDEGLAEYFEGPADRHGLNPEHMGRLPDDFKLGWRPDLARLETLTNVGEMTPRDYRESWAWVHYLLNGPPAGKAAVLGYLADLRSDPDHSRPLSARLDAHTLGAGKSLLAHLERLRTATAPPAPIAAAPSPAPPTVLFQDSPIEPTPAPRTAPRKSPLGRFFALFGWGAKANDAGK